MKNRVRFKVEEIFKKNRNINSKIYGLNEKD